MWKSDSRVYKKCTWSLTGDLLLAGAVVERRHTASLSQRDTFTYLMNQTKEPYTSQRLLMLSDKNVEWLHKYTKQTINKRKNSECKSKRKNSAFIRSS